MQCKLEQIIPSLGLSFPVGLNEIVEAKTIKYLEENNEVNFHDLELGNDFLGMTKSVQAIKEKLALYLN